MPTNISSKSTMSRWRCCSDNSRPWCQHTLQSCHPRNRYLVEHLQRNLRRKALSRAIRLRRLSAPPLHGAAITCSMAKGASALLTLRPADARPAAAHKRLTQVVSASTFAGTSAGTLAGTSGRGTTRERWRVLTQAQSELYTSQSEVWAELTLEHSEYLCVSKMHDLRRLKEKYVTRLHKAFSKLVSSVREQGCVLFPTNLMDQHKRPRNGTNS